jgi:hypothetical protein
LKRTIWEHVLAFEHAQEVGEIVGRDALLHADCVLNRISSQQLTKDGGVLDQQGAVHKEAIVRSERRKRIAYRFLESLFSSKLF